MTHDSSQVFECVQLCLQHLVGGSGHLTSYRLDRETFEITDARQLNEREIAYDFAVEGVATGEFSDVATDDEPASGGSAVSEAVELLSGTLVLDSDGEFLLDEDGQIRIEPFQTLDPKHWLENESFDVERFLDEL